MKKIKIFIDSKESHYFNIHQQSCFIVGLIIAKRFSADILKIRDFLNFKIVNRYCNFSSRVLHNPWFTRGSVLLLTSSIGSSCLLQKL